MSPFFLFFAALASAGVPLVFDAGSADAVRSEASQQTGLPTSQFDPVPLSSLLKALPKPLGEAAMTQRRIIKLLSRT